MSVNQYDETLQQLDQEAGTPAPANPYEETIRLQDEMKTTRLRSSFLQSKDITPDRAAEAQTLSQQTGLPTAIIERNFDTIHKRLEASGVPYQQMVDQTPALAAWAENPAHAAVAKDDLEQLGLLEWMVTAPQRAVARGINQIRFAQLRSESVLRPLTQAEQDQLNAYKFHMTHGGALGAGDSWFRKAAVGAGQLVPNLFGAGLQALKYGALGAAEGAVIGGAVGSVLPGIGTLTAAGGTAAITGRAGMLYGAAKFGFQLESGLAYDEYLDFRDELGQPLDPDIAKAAALATGVINAGLEAYGFEKLLESVPGLRNLTGGLTRSAVKQALRQPSVRAALGGAMASYAGTLTAETVTEVAQRAVTILSGELAKVASGQPMAMRKPGDILTDLGSEAIGALQSFALGVLPGPLLGGAIDVRRARQGAQNVEFFTALGQGIAASKTAQRAPAAVQALLEQATQDGPISHVYAPTDTWTTYWQSKGVDPAQMAAEVTGQPNAYATAIRTGEDLAIPTARYAVTLAGTEHNAYFQNELRLGPDEMNGRESAAFQAQAEAQAAPAEPAVAPAAPVREAVLQQLEAAGVPRATGESYAALYEAAFQTLAERAGVDPVQLFESYGLRVERPSLDMVAGPAALSEQADARTARPEAGPRPRDVAGQRAPADVVRPVEAASHDRSLERRRLPGPGDYPLEAFRKADPQSDAQRLTPEVRQELTRIRGELEEFPFVERTWAWLLPGEKKTGTAAGGEANIVAGAAGAPVYTDILEFSPLNKGTKGEAFAKTVHGTRAQVAAAIATALETGTIPSNLAEGVVRVAERRAAGDYRHLSRPMLPADWGTEATPELVAALSDAIDEALAPQAEPTTSETVDTGEGDTSFDISEFGQALFHGSPHDFERFDLSKIGTGEGAQVYGHGLYFAENEGVAKAYREAGAPRKGPVTFPQMETMAARLLSDGVDPAAVETQLKRVFGVDDWEVRNAVKNAQRKPGRLYQVDIPDEQVAKMLDWDAPASQQPPAVKQAIRELEASDYFGYSLTHFAGLSEADRENLMAKAKPFEVSSGARIYQQIVQELGGSQKKASDWLAARGVPGLRYLDQWSRMADPTEQTRNVVVFDDSIIDITHKDGSPVSAQERREFLQEKQGERRGAIQFGPQQTLINLFAKADLSTFLHESGHFFLEVLRDAGKRPEANPQISADLTTLNDWFFGEGQAGTIGTEQHEQFARGFEAYLMEGKAPSLELRQVFSRFRAWLLGIYRSLKGLNVTLTPEVRQVFDRMLATDQAIGEAEQAGHIAPMFTTAADAGMSEADFGKYRETVADASRVAREQLEQKLLAEVRREQTAAWQAQRDTVEAAVTAEVHQQPVYRALAAMQRGTNPDGSALIEGETAEPMKLSKAILVDRYGKDRLKSLPRPYMYSVEGGLDPDFVAQRFGFTSGDEMLTAVSTAPRMAAVIAAETQRRMLAEHGSLLLDGTLAEKAQAAVANESRDEVIKAEMRAIIGQMRGQAKAGPATIKAAIPRDRVLRQHARDRIAGTHIRDLKPQAFWAASRRAAKQADAAFAKQDLTGAITAKQQELITLALYREAERAIEDVGDRVKFAKSLDTTASRARLGLAGETYQDQVDGILDRYSFATVSRRALDRRASLERWIAAQQGEGLLVDLPTALMEEQRRIPYQELTVEELVGVTDGLKQILHLARLKNRLLKAADVRDFHQVRDGVALSIREKNTVHPVPLEFRPSGEKWRRVAGWFASIRKIAMLARAMDGNVDGGPMWEAFIRPINAAADAKQARNRVEGANYQAVLERHYPGRELGRMGDLTHIPEIGGSLSKEARLAVGLNQGTEGNRDRLLTDSRRTWNREQVAAILDTLDERDWHFIQDTWDFINTFKAEIEAKQRRVTGIAPEMVEASPVQTKFGTFRGGYYPLAYDKRLDIRAGQHEAATELTLAKAANYVHATTRRGFVEERQKHVTLPLRLELGVMFAHVDQVIHDLTHHEMLIDVSRLLRDPQVSRAILDTRGSDVYQQFSTALQDIAIGALADRNWMDRSASFIRKRTQLAMLGANLWTAAQQPLGLFNGADRVGAKWVMRGMTRWLRDAASMENTSKWISDVSPMMRERVQTATPELLELRTQLAHAGGWFDTMVRRVTADHLTQQTILDGYMWHIGLMQRVADIPTWLGQYEKSLDGGETETRAIALADQAVLDSQGGGQIKDLAAVQRGGGMARLFTMFYSYGSTLINANVNALEGANYRSPASVVTLLGHLSLLNIMPAIATVALSAAAGRLRGDPDDPEWWITHVAGEALSGALNGLVMVREATAAIQIALHLDPGVRGYEGPAGTRLFQVLTDTAVQINQGEPDEALAKAVNSAAGILFRYPALQMQRTVDGWIALEEGRTQNPLALVTGAPRKK